MNKKEFVCKIDERLKLVRTEWGYNQEQMASVLGISKKTLQNLGHSGPCTLYKLEQGGHQVLAGPWGDQVSQMVRHFISEVKKEELN